MVMINNTDGREKLPCGVSGIKPEGKEPLWRPCVDGYITSERVKQKWPWNKNVKENHLVQDETNRRTLMKKVTNPRRFHKRRRFSRLGTQPITLQEKFRSMELGNACEQLWSSLTDVMSILCTCNSPALGGSILMLQFQLQYLSKDAKCVAFYWCPCLTSLPSNVHIHSLISGVSKHF